jgi:toxin ParE2
MIEVFFHPKAREDLSQAASYLENQALGLKQDFYNELDQVLDFLSLFPEGFVNFDYGLRRCYMKRFKYNIFYRIIDNQKVVIIAVMHFKRKPFNFLDRL